MCITVFAMSGRGVCLASVLEPVCVCVYVRKPVMRKRAAHFSEHGTAGAEEGA